MRITIDNPNMIDRPLLPKVGKYYDNQPLNHQVRLEFPASDVEGNDDFKITGTEDNDPYHSYGGEVPALAHEAGSLVHLDVPSKALGDFREIGDKDKYYHATFQLENDYATFVRLQIGNAWYRVSGHYNWYLSLRMKYESGTDVDGNVRQLWKNDYSRCDYSGATDN